MIERKELHEQLKSLEAQKAATEKQQAELARTLQQIEGAIRMAQHLIDLSCKKDQEKKAAQQALDGMVAENSHGLPEGP